MLDYRGYKVSNVRIIGNCELGSVWKEEVVSYIKVLSKHIIEETEENHETPQSGQSVSRGDTRNRGLQSNNYNNSTATFGTTEL
jgi:hypothetical protein